MISEIKKFSFYEKLFFILSLIVGVGFAWKSSIFGKMGIPISIPKTWGGIPNQTISIYVFEIYGLAITTFALLQKSFFKKIVLPLPKNKLYYLVLLLLFFGLTRLMIDIKENIILGVRNASFVWYLYFPLLIFSLPIRPLVFEIYSKIILGLIFLYFIYSIFHDFALPIAKILEWTPIIGLYGVYAYALGSKNKHLAIFILFFLGAGFGASFIVRMQRTCLPGFILTLLFFSIWKRFLWKQLIWRHIIIITSAILFFFIFQYRFASINHKTVDTTPAEIISPIHRSGEQIEQFRKNMWEESIYEFLEYPFFGIGFQKPVVKYIRFLPNVFFPNDGQWVQTLAPIAGPHNSYLNALARLGIIGIGFLILHIWVALILFYNQYYGSLAIVFGQIIYALFNVGLESPANSFFILLMIGVALKLYSIKQDA